MNDSGQSTVKLTIGTFTSTINPMSDGTMNIPFTLATSQTVPIELADQGPADNVGLYIGHIVFSSTAATSGVPEPGTIDMAAIACGALMMLRRRHAKRNC